LWGNFWIEKYKNTKRGKELKLKKPGKGVGKKGKETDHPSLG